jgi:DNA-binding MarR family transcriptional regulator
MERKKTIGFELRTVSNLIKRKFDNSSVISHVNKLTGTHGWVIGYLYDRRDKDIFQRDIEKELMIRRSTVTGILQLMEKNGLITREAVNYDARLKKLVLTAKAIELHKSVVGEIDKIEAQLARGFSEEEMEVFFTLLGRIKKNIE